MWRSGSPCPPRSEKHKKKQGPTMGATSARAMQGVKGANVVIYGPVRHSFFLPGSQRDKCRHTSYPRSSPHLLTTEETFEHDESALYIYQQFASTNQDDLTLLHDGGNTKHVFNMVQDDPRCTFVLSFNGVIRIRM